MNAFWIEGTSFCPLDSGFLKKEGTVTLDIYGCPNCKNKYVKINGNTLGLDIKSLSDGFIRPKSVSRVEKNKEAEIGCTLKMKINLKEI